MKMLTPIEAIKYSRKILNNLGFRTDSGFKKDSAYFMKPGYRGRKIRVSNHKPIVDMHYDVVANIIYDAPTIAPDVEFRVKQAIKQYDKFKRVVK